MVPGEGEFRSLLFHAVKDGSPGEGGGRLKAMQRKGKFRELLNTPWSLLLMLRSN